VASRERRLRGVIDALPDPIVMLAPVRDEGGAVVDLAISEANGAAAGFAGAPRAELVGRRASDLLATDPPSRILDVAMPVLETGRPAYLDDIASDRLGILGGRWYDVRVVRVEDGLAVTWHDVTSRHDEVSRLADRVRHDDLTGLLSRAEALDRLGAELGLARLEGRAIAVAFCDVDDFKQINDTFGHAVGDEVLRMLATRVDELVRRGDVVARFGGDELLVIMRDVDDLDTAVGLAERLRDGVRQSLRLPEGDVSVSMSIGVTAVGPEESVDVVIARADEAMYGAKSAGKDRVNALQPSGASAVS
jgi:diguanylate cyclase (GGDEF)-like protein